MNKKLLLILFTLPLLSFGQSMTLSGNPWVVTMNWPFTTVASPDPQIQISVKPAKDLDYLITVQRDDLNWQNELTLYVRRTGDGAGSPHTVPQGGTSWIQISTVPRDFFWGPPKNRNNVPCQYQLVPGWPAEGSYSTTVTYTITSL